MGKEWDHGVPGTEFWEIIRASCKPGAMLMSFGGTRTFHRLTCAIEDAGFEIRDCLMWVYGSGFPKSHDISKAIDKAAGVWRGKAGAPIAEDSKRSFGQHYERNSKEPPATDAARIWNGYGTALKPAWEPIIVAMNPLDGTFANNALTYGVAGLNVDGGRVKTIPRKTGTRNPRARAGSGNCYTGSDGRRQMEYDKITQGRFPANLIHDGSDEVVGQFPRSIDGTAGRRSDGVGLFNMGGHNKWGSYGGAGSAARFFYCAKASRKERGEGNTHPTVKPLALMEYLLNLLQSPTGGVVLDPFAGSGSTLVAARRLGRKAIGIELEEDSCEITESRLDAIDKDS